ncbi:hypothetical protein [Ligilactobacillus salivarius]|uniref:hypothetical protein n=1 Tax=Ligilactobacillus salivarius TaxID=1624 RepID=UPI00117AEA8A|nr:hypothetical protein [Ligilactobacillus salivarius]
MEMKNVDLAALNYVAISIQKQANIGHNLVNIIWTKGEIDSIEYVLKNLGYKISRRKAKDRLILKIDFSKPKQRPYIFVPINILTTIEAKQLAEQNEANRQVVNDFKKHLGDYDETTLIYKIDEINPNNDLLETFFVFETKVYQTMKSRYTLRVVLMICKRKGEVNARVISNNGISC